MDFHQFHLTEPCARRAIMAFKYHYLDSGDAAMCLDEVLPERTTVGQRSRTSLGARSNMEESGFINHPVAIYYLVTQASILG